MFRNLIAPVAALLLATAILYAGNGLQGTLLAIRGNAEDFSLTLIGLLMSAYFVGFIAGCRYIPTIVANVGHIRTFVALASVASASALAHVLLVDGAIWLVLRVVTGFCFAGLAMVLESWINERATNQTRGQLLSIYRIVDLSALTAGQLMLGLADPQGFALFALVSILVSLALVPVALTRSAAPNPISAPKLDLRGIFIVSPLAGIGSMLSGFANTAFWALGPVFVQLSGFRTELVGTFMAVTIIGGAISQWPLGLWSDRVDRRYVILATSALAIGAASVLFFGQGQGLLLLGGFLFGAFAIPLFGLCIAHANDYAEPDTYVQLNSGLLMLYGMGAVIGPVIGSSAMDWLGAQGLFGFTMLVHTVMIAVGVFRLVVTRNREVEFKDDYQAFSVPVSVPTGTPEGFEMDPRLEEEDVTADDPTPESEAARQDA